jgi:CheY-like chemotaxis protein
MDKKRILVADIPEGRERVKQALKDQPHELVLTDSLREAKELLKHGGAHAFDLIICGMHFDDSRMFDLLQFVRRYDTLEELPFVVIRERHAHLQATTPSTLSSAPLLGVCRVIETGALSDEDSNRILREAIEYCLNRPVKQMRYDKRTCDH